MLPFFGSRRADEHVRSALRGGARFHRRWPADEHERGAGPTRALRRDRARVISRRATFLVRLVTLVIDDDETEIAHRREHRCAAPDRDSFRARLYGQPVSVPLARAAMTPQLPQRLGERVAESRQYGAANANLRQQHEDAAAFRSLAGHRDDRTRPVLFREWPPHEPPAAPLQCARTRRASRVGAGVA